MSAADPCGAKGFFAVRPTHSPNLTYSCCPAGRGRHKAFGRYLMRCERIGVDRGSKSRRQYKLSGYEPQRLGEKAYIRLQKSIELASVANGDARHRLPSNIQ